MSGYGYIVIRRGTPADIPYAAGDVVDVYPLAAPLVELAEHEERAPERRRQSTHAAAARLGEAVAAARRLTELALVTCPCRGATDPPMLARVVRGPDGDAWAVIARERVPAAFRAGRSPAPTAWPLHSERNGPHVEMTTCAKCRRTWAIVLTWSTVSLVDVSRPAYSSRVVE